MGKLWGAALHLHNGNVTVLPGHDCSVTEMSEGNIRARTAARVLLGAT